MKVALVEIWRHGGTARYAAELARGLEETKNESDEVHLIVPRNFEDPAATYNIHKVLPELTGARWGGPPANAAALSWLRSRQIKRATYELEEIKPEIVHVLGTSLAGNAFFSHARKLNAKVLITVHDLPFGKGWRQLLFNLWSRHFTKADGIIVHGKDSKSQIQSKFGSNVAQRTSVFPLGFYDFGPPQQSAEQSRHNYSLPQDQTVILFFGSLRKNKGLEILLRALPLAGAGAHLFVAGQRPANSEPTVEWYQELSRTLGIEDRVTWLIRHVEDKEIPEIFNCVDLAVLPYMKSFEAQSSVLSIAAAYDVPVIASDVANIGETVREFELGLCVESESAEQLAEGLRTLAITPRSSNTSAQRFARISNWTEVGRQYWLLYRDQLHSLGKGENT